MHVFVASDHRRKTMVEFTEAQKTAVKEVKTRLGMPTSHSLNPLVTQWLKKDGTYKDITPDTVDAFVAFVKDKYFRGF